MSARPPAGLGLEGFDNGRLPPAELEDVGGIMLARRAAPSWRRMVAAAARDGVTIRASDGYRTYDAQVDVARRKGLYGQGGLAAVPGTSNHGWAAATDVDLGLPGALAWLRANGRAFGWTEDVPGEPWHWEWSPSGATAEPSTTPAAATSGTSASDGSLLPGGIAGDIMRVTIEAVLVGGAVLLVALGAKRAMQSPASSSSTKSAVTA